MTDTTKPMWKRCDGCKARIFNEAVDIAAHRANCPADLARRIQKLATLVDTLKDRIFVLEGQVDETAELLAVDPNAVDEDGFGTLDDDEQNIAEFDTDDELEDVPAPACTAVTPIPTIGGIA